MTSTKAIITPASGADDLAQAAALFREYAASLPPTGQASLAFQGFDQEAASLPGKYAPPEGVLLLARHEGRAVGCVALRKIGSLPGDPAPVCEMKRLYVSPRARGLGAGRALCESLLAHARSLGYRMMKLDTEPDLAAALALYHSLGFHDIPRYNDDPVSCTLWMGRAL